MDLDDKLAPNFCAYEFAEHHGQLDVLPEDPKVLARIADLALAAQALRDGWARHIVENTLGGSPIVQVICGWRSPEHNAAVGGALNSRHMRGDAMDCACDVSWARLRRGMGTLRDIERMRDFASFTEKFVDKTDIFGGFGLYTNVPTQQCYWLHLDLRPRVNGHVDRWTGHHVGSER